MKKILSFVFIVVFIKMNFAQILAGQTGSGVVYKDFIPDTSFVSTSMYAGYCNLDLNNDGTFDYKLNYSFIPNPGSETRILRVDCLNNNEVISSTTGYADTMPIGQNIDNSFIWSSGTGIKLEYFYSTSSSTQHYGDWRYSDSGYLGVRIISPVDTTYGYIHIYNNHLPSYKVMDFAIEYKGAIGINDILLSQTDVGPNPFSDKIFFKGENNLPLEVILYNISSNVIFRKTFTGKIEVNTQELLNGFYIYELRRNDYIIKRGKLLKNK
jgi:hypothetical protein